MWRLAREGDSAALHRAADMLLDDRVDLGYEGRRARAFALAVEDRTGEALAQLEQGRAEDWPIPAAYAADVGRIRFLAGDYAAALEALKLGVRGVARVDGSVAELAAACVRRSPRLWGKALRLSLSRGRPLQRISSALAILHARFARRSDYSGMRSTILPS